MINARKVALDVVNSVFYKDAYSNIVLNMHLNKSNLKDKDKALVTEIVYGTIKYKLTIDKIIQSYLKSNIKKLDKDILNILRITIYQIRYLDKIPEFAAVNEAVNLSKRVCSKFSKLVNGVLRNYIRDKNKKIYYNGKDVLESLSFNYSFPKWMIKLFINQYGEKNSEDILKGLNERPNITVRVNDLKSDYDSVFEEMTKEGYNIEPGFICPEAIKIFNGKNIENNILFKKGKVTVQDESAMLVAPSMDLKENMVVLDLCSAPGGKTTHISEITSDKSTVHAYDLHENKLCLIQDNANRLGIKNIVTKSMDASLYKEELENFADRILIDVPCSGLGIIRKKPEIKWNKNTSDINNLIHIQRKIMKNSAKYLKDNGVLLYSTCTLNKKENEENVKWFLRNNKHFKIEKLYYGNCDNIIYHKEGYVTVLPNKSMDGFFICRMRKIVGV